jgi:hypothetical protein
MSAGCLQWKVRSAYYFFSPAGQLPLAEAIRAMGLRKSGAKNAGGTKSANF